MHKKNEKNIAMGIDLGTTYSLAALIIKNKIEILSDKKNQPLLLPSVVYYKNTKKTIVGHKAKKSIKNNPSNVIFSVKRLIGRSFNFVKKHALDSSYSFKASKNNKILISTSQGLKTPVSIASEILSNLKHRICKKYNRNISNAVITVPAYYDDIQRKETKIAAEMAGLNVLRLLNEPTAAAIAYGIEVQTRKIIAVYDLGGGTFDISILKIEGGIFDVLSINGDSHLGGDDFDHLLFKYILSKLNVIKSYNFILEYQIKEIIEECKIFLSQNKVFYTKINNVKIIISLEEFNHLITPLIDRTIVIFKQAINDASISVNQIDKIIMVGGSSRIPLIKEKIKFNFKQNPLISPDPDQIVVKGAAIHANFLVGNSDYNRQIILLDVLPISLGIEVMGNVVEKIISKNTKIPVSETQLFTTFQNNQTIIKIHVLQGEGTTVNTCRSLAHFNLINLPPKPAGQIQVFVTFQVNVNGLLTVIAEEKSNNIKNKIDVHIL